MEAETAAGSVAQAAARPDRPLWGKTGPDVCTITHAGRAGELRKAEAIVQRGIDEPDQAGILRVEKIEFRTGTAN